MTFSIIVPSLNAARYIEETLASVEKQTYTDYELIIVDDGSWDATSEMICRFVSEYPRTITVSKKNEGPLLARRDALKCCSGDYVVFLDADDVLHPETLERVSEVLERSNVDILEYGLTRNQEHLGRAFRSTVEVRPVNSDSIIRMRERVSSGLTNNLCGKVIRIACFDLQEDYSPFVGMMHGEDLFQLLPVVDRAKTVLQITDSLYYYRKADSTSTSRFRQRQLADVDTLFERLLLFSARWGGNCVVNALREEATLYVSLLCLAADGEWDSGSSTSTFDNIRVAMETTGALGRSEGIKLRLDVRLILSLLLWRKYHTLKKLLRFRNLIRNGFR